jgi:tetratricopeptide (TPR) repeat protein
MTPRYTITWSEDLAQAPLRAPAPAASHVATHLRWAIGGAVLAVVAGCATQDTRVTPSWRVDPVFSVSHAVDAAQQSQRYVALGRSLDESRAWDRSVDAYRMAVTADARNVEALNGLGVALAHLGLHADAEAALRQAIALAPDRTSIRNNLGYVLLLAGRPGEAAVELTTAVERDGRNTIALANLHEARTRAGLPDADIPAPVAAVPAIPLPAPVAEAPAAAAIAPVPGHGADGNEVRPVEPRETRVADAGSTATASPLEGTRLEVSNGNGTTGMATQVSTWLAARGIPTAHVTNWPTFDQPQTVIQFRSGYEDAARRLAGLLPAPATPEAKPTPGLRTDVRVVLGRDWSRSTPCLAADACQRTTRATRVASD